MKIKFYTIICLLGYSFLSTAQETLTFEDISLPQDSFINQAEEGFFDFEGIYFPNDFNEEWQSWSGWAVSTSTDNTTPGYANQYAAISGAGAEQSTTYMTAYNATGNYIKFSSDQFYPSGMSINNATYTYLSMRDGDAFAKKFGGESGDDPDYFTLHIKRYFNETLVDSLDFRLADFTFEDNAQDYIVDEWTDIEFPSTLVDSISFSLSSSDVGSFGMNTPAYFCLDNLQYALSVGTHDFTLQGLRLKGNLVQGQLNIESDWNEPLPYSIFSAQSQLVQTGMISKGSQTIRLEQLTSGTYYFRVYSNEGVWVSPFVNIQ